MAASINDDAKMIGKEIEADEEETTEPSDMPVSPIPDASDSIEETAPVGIEDGNPTTTDADDAFAEARIYDPLVSAAEQRSRITSMKVVQVPGLSSCLHEAIVPVEQEYKPLVRDQNKLPARTYAFPLDPFQQQAILCIENDRSVLVSAHTSAGKTVVAEYAIAVSFGMNKRVVYTTPIKALSNQKYREFVKIWGEEKVGLLTGDVTINPDASCLIMTTEILRSMLFRGSEVMREVGWVVFDEIHYMRDESRGVVWEETIILLPDNVRYVFLSATIPNALQFARWIAWLHKQYCHVVYTEYRPVPLVHFIYPAGGNGLYRVVDEEGKFNEKNFQMAVAEVKGQDDENDLLQPSAAKKRRSGPGGGGKGSGASAPADPVTSMRDVLVKMMVYKHDPVIVFCFSRRDCEHYATKIASLVDFIEKFEEKTFIKQIYDSALDVLSEEDRSLPQFKTMLPILQRGIAIHHSGLLPIIKETVEILFQEGFVKVLFATETFAMGLNMPAKTVLFTSAQKYDGKETRWISSGEYIQMSGRAGRRGKDDRGFCILNLSEKISLPTAKSLFKGAADALHSAFHLTYNSVLNLIRVEGINPEYLLERTFMQFQIWDQLPKFQDKLTQLKEERDAIQIPEERHAKLYFKMLSELQKVEQDLQRRTYQPHVVKKWLEPGRLIRIKRQSDQVDFGWALVCGYRKRAVNNNPAMRGKDAQQQPYKRNIAQEAVRSDNVMPEIVDVLISVRHVDGLPDTMLTRDVSKLQPALNVDEGTAAIVPFDLGDILQISTIRINEMAKSESNFNDTETRKKLLLSMMVAVERVKALKDGIMPLVDPVEHLRVDPTTLKGCMQKVEKLKEGMARNPLHASKNKQEIQKLWDRKEAIAQEMRLTKKSLDDMHNLSLIEDLKNRVKVLKELNYVSSNLTVDLKGQVACELSCADELLLTEMLFQGTFNDLNVAQVAALLSCFVCESSSSKDSKAGEMLDKLAEPFEKMRTLAKKIGAVCKANGVLQDEDEYVESFKPGMMDVVHRWAQGAKFKDIMATTEIFEGSIVRSMRLLEELLRQMCQAATVMGSDDLKTLFNEAIVKIKRDIIFCASLYL